MFKKQMYCITRYDTVTADENNCLKLSNAPLQNSLKYIHRLTPDGYIGTGYPVSDANEFVVNGNVVSCNRGIITSGATYFCTYNTMDCVSKIELIRGEVEGSLARYIPGDKSNAKKRFAILQKHMDCELEQLRCEDVLSGKIPDRIDGDWICWSLHNGSLTEAHGEVIYASFSLGHKIRLSMIGDHFVIVDIRHDGKNDFWEYSSDGDTWMPGPPCCSERSRHRLGDNRIEKYLNQLRAFDSAPTTKFCDQAEKLWRNELAARYGYEE